MKNDNNRSFRFDPDHVPSVQFKQQLKKQVLATYEPNKRTHSMKVAYVFGLTVVMSVAVIVGVITFVKKDSKQINTVPEPIAKQDNLKQVLIKPSYNSASGGGGAASSSLAGQQSALPTYSMVENAATAIGFKPFYLTKSVNQEQLTELYSAQGLSGGSETTLYMSFGTANKIQYQILQTKVAEDTSALIPEEVQRVDVIVKGQALKATRNEFWNETTPKEDIYAGTPRQSVAFYYNGIAVEITEYGDISLDQIKQIVTNLDI